MFAKLKVVSDLKNEVTIMRFIITIVWSILLGSMVSFILSSIGEQPFSMGLTLMIAGVFSVAVFLLSEVGLKPQDDNA